MLLNEHVDMVFVEKYSQSVSAFELQMLVFWKAQHSLRHY